MTTIISGSSPSVTFSDSSSQTTSAIVGGYIPYANMPVGSVLQVINSVKTDAQSTTSTSYVDITGLSATITPKFTTSKILVMARVNNIGMSDANGIYINLLRNATTIVSSTAGGGSDAVDAWATGGGGGMSDNNRKMGTGALDYLDSPATTSATTYKLQVIVTGGTGTINRWQLNSDQASVSSITVMEIVA